MSSPPQKPYALLFERWTKVVAAYAMITGASILLGWYTGLVSLKRLMPGEIVIKANTGALFLVAGLVLWLLQAKAPPRRLMILRQSCSILVLLIGALTLAEYLFGWDLGIDQLIIREMLEYGGVFPGRMAPATAASFILLGASLFLRGEQRRARLAQLITVPMIVLALVSVIGYIFGAKALIQIGTYTAIALPTAVTFFILGVGVNLVRPDEGGMAVLMSPGAGGLLARNILPAAIVLPIALGWAQLLVEATNRYDELVVEALAAAVEVVVLTGVAAWSILVLHRVELERQSAGDEVRRLNMELEERVRMRTAELELTNRLLVVERDHLHVLMENVPDTIYFKDAAARFTRINRAQARTLGVRDPQQAIGKRDADFFAAESAARAYADDQQVIQTGKSIVDRRESFPGPGGQTRWFSSTKVPILDKEGKAVGLIGISRDITDHVEDEQVAGEENAQLNERVQLMALVIELDEQLQSCASDQEVYQVAFRLVSRMFPGELGALYFIDPAHESVETAVTWGEPPLEPQTFELDDCWALRRGKAHYSGGNRAGEVCAHLAGSPATYSVCLPLSAAGERLGILHLRTAPGGVMRDSSAVQKQSAQLVAESLALAWANLRLRESLHEQAVRDPLTGLYNRRHMQVSLERELRRAAGTPKPIGIMMLDIDHFKAINDAHGHDAGDLVLRELGRFLKEHTRVGDTACRLGGEEFLVILPDANLEQTAARAEKHIQNFGAVRILYAGGSVPTPTLSIGVAAYPKHGATAEELLRAADRALYAAKEAGRDRVAAAE